MSIWCRFEASLIVAYTGGRLQDMRQQNIICIPCVADLRSGREQREEILEAGGKFCRLVTVKGFESYCLATWTLSSQGTEDDGLNFQDVEKRERESQTS